MPAPVIYWKPNHLRKYPQTGAAGVPVMVPVYSVGPTIPVGFSGIGRAPIVNSGAVGTRTRAQLVNGGGA